MSKLVKKGLAAAGLVSILPFLMAPPRPPCLNCEVTTQSLTVRAGEQYRVVLQLISGQANLVVTGSSIITTPCKASANEVSCMFTASSDGTANLQVQTVENVDYGLSVWSRLPLSVPAIPSPKNQ